MTDIASPTVNHRIPSHALIPFIVLTFAITWGLVGLYIVAPERASAILGDISGTHPVFIIATWGPAISAFILILALAGTSGFRRYLSRLALWRCSPGWLAFLVLGIPLIFAAGALVKGNLFTNPIPPDGFGALLPVMAFMMILGPIEEFGWRGLAQPILQRHVAPVVAGLLDRGNLGHLAPASLLPQRNRSKRMELHTLLLRQHRPGSHRDTPMERVTRQHPSADAVPLSTHQPALAGCTAL